MTKQLGDTGSVLRQVRGGFIGSAHAGIGVQHDSPVCSLDQASA